MKSWIVSVTLGFILFCTSSNFPQKKIESLKFSISFSESIYNEPIDGRLILIISKDSTNEPRFQISEWPNTQQVFGINIEKLSVGTAAVINDSAFGYPLNKLSEVPSGEYLVQAVINIYEDYNLSNGKVVKLPTSLGEGQRWNIKPGNIYSSVKKIFIDRTKSQTFKVLINNKIAPIPEPIETKYIKHVRLKSELLSKFWGKPVYLGANILLPKDFENHPEAKYPLMVFHGHFTHTFGGFSEAPPDTMQPEINNERFQMDEYNNYEQEYAFRFYKEWIAPDFPRFVIIEIQHSNPYYDDSYAVNSANLGPYGDAINYELIPFIEKKFRCIGESWSRFLYGGSTGGWEALATQIFYPDEYNGCFASCPDPIDFRAYTIVNIYEDENAYYTKGDWVKIERPAIRDYLGHVKATMKSSNYFELAFGDKNRSGEQWDIWEAVFSPMGEDGYPKRIWNKQTGEINHEVAEYWKENYDLCYILKRDWKKIGKKLEGKIHIYVGSMDTYYLNNAVYLMQDFLESTSDPYYAGEIDYGDRAEHCWNGDHSLPNAFSRLRYNQMYVPKIMERISSNAPLGADLTSWRYK